MSDRDNYWPGEDLPDCTMRRAWNIGSEREQREDGMTLGEELKHLFPPDMPADDAKEALTDFTAFAGLSALTDIMDFAKESGEHPSGIPLHEMLGMAFAEGMLFGAHAQRLYEQETRDSLDAIPEAER